MADGLDRLPPIADGVVVAACSHLIFYLIDNIYPVGKVSAFCETATGANVSNENLLAHRLRLPQHGARVWNLLMVSKR